MFESERFFREAWPEISPAMESSTDAARDVDWIVGVTGMAAGACVLDADVVASHPLRRLA